MAVAQRGPSGGTGDQTHYPVPQDHHQDVGRGDRQDGCDPWPVGAPLREPRHVPVVPRRADDRRDDHEHRQPAPAEPAGDPPGDEVDERTQGEVDQQERQEVRLPGDRHVPPPHLLTEGDDAQGHHTEGYPASHGPRDAPRRRTREEGDNDQDGQV